MKRRKRILFLPVVALAALLAGILPVARPVGAAASLRLSRVEVAPGDGITVAGFGFRSGDNAVISATFAIRGGTQRVAAAVGVSNSGTFAANLIVPSTATQGTYSVIARDFQGNQATHAVLVLPLVYVRAGISSGPVTVPANSAFYVRGAGFLPHEPIAVSVTIPLYAGRSSTSNQYTPADSAGRLGTLRFGVPLDARQGRVTLLAFGASSKRSGRALLDVRYRPSLVLAQSVVRPGAPVAIVGRGWVAQSHVRSTLAIPRANGQYENLTRDAGTDIKGNFTTTLLLPSDVRPGTYTVSAVDLRGGFRVATSLRVTVNPVLSVLPSTVAPGQTLSVNGSGFGLGVPVTVSARFPTPSGRSTTASSTLFTRGDGSFSTRLTVPRDAVTATVTVIAHTANAEGRAQLLVRVPPTPTPTPTATPVPPTSTPVPPPHHVQRFRFQYVSLWYHPVRQGKFDHLEVQGRPHRYLGVWVHIDFASGRRLSYYQATNSHGFWQADFQIPRHAITQQSNVALITVQLWKGSRVRKTFLQFSVLR